MLIGFSLIKLATKAVQMGILTISVFARLVLSNVSHVLPSRTVKVVELDICFIQENVCLPALMVLTFQVLSARDVDKIV